MLRPGQERGELCAEASPGEGHCLLRPRQERTGYRGPITPPPVANGL